MSKQCRVALRVFSFSLTDFGRGFPLPGRHCHLAQTNIRGGVFVGAFAGGFKRTLGLQEDLISKRNLTKGVDGPCSANKGRGCLVPMAEALRTIHA